VDYLSRLENTSIRILREAYANFKSLCMLWSIGKDSTVMLWLARKAFFGHVPFPLVNLDTGFQIPEMIDYRDRLAKDWGLTMLYGQNTQALDAKQTYPDGNATRIDCCRSLLAETLKNTLAGTWPRFKLNLKTGQ
jgi:sulfate adenylyltransferase subunit 2